MSVRPAVVAILGAAAWVWASGAEAAAVLFVRTDRDAAMPCPAGGLLAEAVARSLPDIDVRTAGTAGGDDIDVSLESDESAFRLTVRRPDGAVLLKREVARPRGGCAQLAQTCVLILDRLLRDIEWKGRSVGIDPSAIARPAPQPPAPAVSRGPFWVDAGVASRLGLDRGEAGVGLEIGVGLGTRPGAMVRLQAFAFLPTATAVFLPNPRGFERPLGTVSVLPAALLASAGYCVGDDLGACVSLTTGALAGWASSHGSDIHARQAAFSVRGAAGATVSAGARLPFSLRGAVDVLTLARLAPTRILVEGIATPVYQAPNFEIVFTAGIARTFW